MMLNEEEEKWYDEEPPVACGNFCLGKTTEISQDRIRVRYGLFTRDGVQNGAQMQITTDSEYGVVEVLSSVSVNDGATFIPLVKINGFVSLFATAKDRYSFVIPSNCIDSTSSRIAPETEQSTQKENDGVAQFSVKYHNDVTSEQIHPHGKIFHGSDLGGSCLENCLSLNVFTYPDSDFHNFDEDRSCETSACGQIWALYSDLDKFMDYIRKAYTKWQFDIHPQVGEVWAVYMNWSPDWASSGNNGHSEYAIGEIRGDIGGSTIFTFLTKVVGYTAVFKPDMEGSTEDTN
ncbi:hypothetical protein ACP70R_007516 [Stipagrostis hirtigluma subsp. patula]